MEAAYPGDDALDWVALDGYNFGSSRPDIPWRPFAEIFGSSCRQLRRLSDKPVMIAEAACAEEGGSKADWITEGFLRSLRPEFPYVQAIVWFNERQEADWRIDSSRAALGAFRKVAAHPAFRGAIG